MKSIKYIFKKLGKSLLSTMICYVIAIMLFVFFSALLHNPNGWLILFEKPYTYAFHGGGVIAFILAFSMFYDEENKI